MASATSATTPPARTAGAEHAALAILRLSHAHAGKLLLVALGPLTNLALALKLDPTLPSRVARLVVMGGAVTAHGNITAGGRIQHRLRSRGGAHRVRRVPAHRTGRLGSGDGARLPARDVRALAAAPIAARALLRGDLAPDPRLGRRPPRRRLAFAPMRLAMALALHRRARWKSPSARWRSSSRAATRAGPTIVDWRREEGRPDNVAILLRYDQARVRGRWLGRGAGGRVRESACGGAGLRRARPSRL